MTRTISILTFIVMALFALQSNASLAAQDTTKPVDPVQTLIPAGEIHNGAVSYTHLTLPTNREV